MPKPSFCSNCPISHVTEGYVPLCCGGGSELWVGEAAGEEEAIHSKPFVGGAGAWLNSMLRAAKISRSSINIVNTIGCFVSPRTLVLTPRGWVELYKLKENDLTLTHQGRFRRIIQIVRNPAGRWNTRKIRFSTGDFVTVTEDHKFFTDTWMFASDLHKGNAITRLSERCIWCGTKTNRRFTHQLRSIPFCSRTCHNRYVASKAKAAVSASMHEQYASGKRDRYAITKAANAAFRAMVQEGWRPANIDTPEFRQIQRVKSALARQAKGHDGTFGWIGNGERELADLFEAAEYDYTPQFALDGFNFDFKVGELLVEVDGPGAFCNKKRRIIDAKKEVLAKEHGYNVVHVPFYDVKQALSHIQNDTHEFLFSDVEIVDIEDRVWTRPVWTLQVEEDESYVAQGVVNHNCRPPQNVYPTDSQWSKAVEFHFQKQLKDLEQKLAKHEKKHGDDATTQQLRKNYDDLAAKLPFLTSTNEQGRAAVEYCYQHHLAPTLASKRWSRIVALGDQALYALTGRKGISLWRGSPLPLKGKVAPQVIPTLHPAYLMRNAGLFSIAVGDLRRRPVVPTEHYNLYPTLDEVKAFRSPVFGFDFEWDEWGNITLCGLCDRYNTGMVVPWQEEYIPELRRIFENATALVGHNIVGADTRHFERLGWNVTAKPYDTMLMQHLVQPDMRHNLAFVASVFSNKVFWKGNGEEEEDEDGNFVPTGAQWRTWDSPNALPKECGGYGGCVDGDEAYRLYNARDTDASFQCMAPLNTLLRKFDMEKTYWNVSVPAGYICRELCDKGLKVDNSKVQNIREELLTEIAKLEVQLPQGLAPYDEPITKQVEAPKGTYKTKAVKCKGSKKNKTSHTEIVILVTSPEGATCPSCNKEFKPKLHEVKRIKVSATKRVTPWNSTQQVLNYAKQLECKTVLHAKTGNETANKTARRAWGREHVEFALVDSLKKLSTQANSFAKKELLDTDRVYFNLLVHGTSEGRLSSSGRRRGIDPNIQNQPKAIRKIFVPDHDGWGFLASDIVQGENMMTAWLAEDWERWERLHSPGFDEHSYMASQFFNKAYELVCKGGAEEYLRKPGKVINHGRNYGLGIKTTQVYLEEQGFFYSLADIQEMIEIWKKVNKRTAEWQKETVAIAQHQGYLRNMFGRRRWFQSRDYATKALAFLPASTLADAVLRMMIALYPDRFAKEIQELNLQMVGTLPPDWSLRIQVHDELTCQGPAETHVEAARVLQAVMTQPWPELNGFRFDVDMKFSTKSWGDGQTLTLDEQRKVA